LDGVLGGSRYDVEWVATGYTLAEGIGIPHHIFWAIRRKRFYLIIRRFFAIGSAVWAGMEPLS